MRKPRPHARYAMGGKLPYGGWNGLAMTNTKSKIIYTHTDEAPALATYSFLPIIQTFARACDVDVELRDISLAGRIIAVFPERLTKEQQLPDALTELAELAKRP